MNTAIVLDVRERTDPSSAQKVLPGKPTRDDAKSGFELFFLKSSNAQNKDPDPHQSVGVHSDQTTQADEKQATDQDTHEEFLSTSETPCVAHLKDSAQTEILEKKFNFFDDALKIQSVMSAFIEEQEAREAQGMRSALDAQFLGHASRHMDPPMSRTHMALATAAITPLLRPLYAWSASDLWSVHQEALLHANNDQPSVHQEVDMTQAGQQGGTNAGYGSWILGGSFPPVSLQTPLPPLTQLVPSHTPPTAPFVPLVVDSVDDQIQAGLRTQEHLQMGANLLIGANSQNLGNRVSKGDLHSGLGNDMHQGHNQGSGQSLLQGTLATGTEASSPSDSALTTTGFSSVHALTQNSSIVTPGHEAQPMSTQQAMQRVLAQRIEILSQQGVERALIRLDQFPDLGNLEIALRHEAGTLQVRISAINADTVHQLRLLGEGLRQDLSTRQFTEVNVQVSQTRNSEHNASQHHRQQGREDMYSQLEESLTKPGKGLKEEGHDSGTFTGQWDRLQRFKGVER